MGGSRKAKCVATTFIISFKNCTMNSTFLGCQSRLFYQANNLIGASPLNQIHVEEAGSHGS